jgi:uroporphyrinogen decarboxylase
LHICGDTTHLWPSLATLGVDVFDLDYMCSMEEAFQIFGPGVIRCGNINPVSIQDLPPGEIFQRCTGLIEAEKGRKFMLSGGCEITFNTPPQNLLSMRKSCK